ncbi:MAG: hypothetical protein ACETWK_04235 [Candidatus Aminicenantaceae bacterium]
MINLNKYEPFYNFGKTIRSRELYKLLMTAINSLFNELQNIKPLDLNISKYNRRYFLEKLANLKSELVRDAYIVGSILCDSRTSLDDFVLIEYGGGIGLLSLLSKKLGIGNVLYNDIYDVSCEDAREIAQTLECEAEHYIQGGIDELVRFCHRHKIKADGIVSYDVIEHIYNIDDFLRKLHLISHEGTAMMHASGANIFYYPYVKSVTKEQKEIEAKGREKKLENKKRDSLLSYSQERKKIIKDYSPSLNESEVARMVTNTRGLMRDDILKCVDQYINCKEFPKLIEHPTNTCDPYTGDWMEHLMNPYYLQETLSFNGFYARVIPSYRTEGNNFIKNILINIVNYIIRKSNTRYCLYFCSFYSIYTKYNGTFSDEIHIHHKYKYHRSPVRYITKVLWDTLSPFLH